MPRWSSRRHRSMDLSARGGDVRHRRSRVPPPLRTRLPVWAVDVLRRWVISCSPEGRGRRSYGISLRGRRWLPLEGDAIVREWRSAHGQKFLTRTCYCFLPLGGQQRNTDCAPPLRPRLRSRQPLSVRRANGADASRDGIAQLWKKATSGRSMGMTLEIADGAAAAFSSERPDLLPGALTVVQREGTQHATARRPGSGRADTWSTLGPPLQHRGRSWRVTSSCDGRMA
jgi:hypothetical protein